jgi:hypothetical protein
MRLFEELWLRLYFNVYKYQVFVSDLLGTPFTLIYRNKKVKEFFYRKHGIKNPEHFARNAKINPSFSIVIQLTDSCMLGLVTCFMISDLNVISGIIGRIIPESFVVYAMVAGIPSIIINHLLLWKNDKYLTHFKEFEKESKEVKRKWAWISFTIVLGIILILIASYWIMIIGLNRE